MNENKDAKLPDGETGNREKGGIGKKVRGNLKKQIICGGLYLALAAAVVGLTTRSVTKLISTNLDEMQIPTTDEIKKELDIEDITFPEIPMTSGYEQEVSGNENGISAQIDENENTNTDDPLSAPYTEEQVSENVENIVADELPASSDLSPSLPASGEPEYPTEPDDGVFTNGVYAKPADGYITREYSVYELLYSPSMNDFRTHSGIDIAGDIGSEVRAFCDGVISDIYNDELMGTTVVIEHADGIYSYYQNLSDSLAKNTEVGAQVKAGQVIGGIGESALAEYADVPHLHFEIRAAGRSIDPTLYLK